MANEFRIKKGLIVNETDLYVSGSEVGIGTTNPAATLTVAGNISGSGTLNIDGTATVDGVLNVNSYIYIDRADERMIVMEDSGGDNTGYLTMNDSQGNMQLMLGVDGDGHYVVTNDGAAKLLYTAHGQDGILSMNAGQQGTANQDVVFTIGISADSNDNTIKVGASNDNVGLDVGEGNTVFDASGNLYTENIYARNANGLNILDDSGTLGIFIEDGGNVGIGTTSPPKLLSVDGSDTLLSLHSSGNAYIHIDRSLSARSSYIGFTTNGDMTDTYPITNLNWALGVTDSDVIPGDKFFISRNHGQSASTSLTIDQSSRIGIQNNSPSGSLHIGDNDGTRRIILHGANSQTTSSEIIFGDAKGGAIPDVTYAGMGIRYDSQNNNLSVRRFWNGSSEVDESFVNFVRDTRLTSFTSNVEMSGDLTVGGIVTAQEFHTEFVSASIIYQSGSTKFGDTSDDVHAFTGSLQQSGSNSYFLGKVGIGETDLSGDIGLYVKKAAGTVIKSETTATNANPDVLIVDADNNNARASLQIQGNGGSVESLWVSSTGNVGIGTTAPDYELDVAGDIGVNQYIYHNGDTNTYIRFQTDDINLTAGGSNLFRVDNTAPVREIVVNEAGAATNFRVESDTVTAALFVTGSTGNVGIGTTSPDYRLTVQGAATAGYALNLKNADGNEGIRFYLDGATGTSNQGSAIFLGDPSSSTFTTSISIDSRLGNNTYFNNGGNVGIGTTSPSERLQVVDSANDIQVRLGTGNAGINPTLRFHGKNTADTTNVYADIRVNPDNQTLGFSGTGTSGGSIEQDALVIDSSGNVGIGTTNPSQKLEVDGNILVGDNHFIGNQTTFDNLLLQSSTDENIVLSSARDIYLSTGGTGPGAVGTLRLFVSSSGNVGIGTTSPVSNAKITNMGNMTFGIPGNGTNTSGRFISIEGNTDASGEGSGRIFFTEHNSSTGAMSNYGMSIGYRGGGTSIVGADGNTWTGLGSIANGEWGMWGHDNNATGALIMYGPRSGASVTVAGDLFVNDYARIDALRVGTTSTDPGDGNLYVEGDVTVTGTSSGILVDSSGHASLRLDRGSTTSDNNLLFYTAGVLKWRLWQDGSDDYLYIRDEVNSSNMVTFETGGNVGIGTTSPATTLDVDGDITANSFFGDTLNLNSISTNDEGKEYTWFDSNSSSSGTTWYKVADITLGAGSFSGVTLEVEYYYPNSNHGSSADIQRYFGSVRCTRSSGTDGDTDDAEVNFTDANRIRVVKTALGVYELQARANVNNRAYGVTYRILSSGGATITPASSKTAGSTSGTAYTGSPDDGLIYKFGGTVNVGSDLNVDGGTLFVDSASDEVGIGTTGPTEKLEVTGNAILDASNANLKIKAGVTGTKGDIQWTFNTDSTVYASAGIEYDNRGTDGFLIDSGYPITMDFNASYIRWRYQGSEKMRLNTSGNLGIGTTNPSQKLTVAGTISGSSDLSIDGNSVFDGTVGYNTFNSGFGGNGWRIDSNANAEFENLTVRGTFSVYELLAQQIRATNGSLLVATSGKVDTSTGGATGTLTFDTGNVYGHGFLANDIVLAQRLDTGGTSLKRTFLRVDSRVDSGSLTYTVLDGDNPEAGQEFVRIGNTTDTDRQGHIYLTADDNFAPYIGVRDGVNAYTDFTSGTGSVEKVRVGRLDGVTSANFGSLSGYGLWASGSVYLEGGINATFGEIAGWTINTDSISGGDATLASSGNLTLGTSNDVVRLSADDGTYRLWTGHATAGSAPFRVTKGGAVTATSATITGNITAETGYIGTAAAGFDINSSYFANGKTSLTDANAGVYVGTDGISLGANSVFKVEDDGALTATDATITGNITANTGTIGGFTISSDALSGTNFYLSGSATGNQFFISSSNFNVKANGDVTGSQVLFTGGKVGGFDITSDKLSITSGDFEILQGSLFSNNIGYRVVETTGGSRQINMRYDTADDSLEFLIFKDSNNYFNVGDAYANQYTGWGLNLRVAGEDILKVENDIVTLSGFTATKDAFAGDNFYISGSATGNEFFISSSNFNVKANGDVTASNASLIGGTIGDIEINGTAGSLTSGEAFIDTFSAAELDNNLWYNNSSNAGEQAVIVNGALRLENDNDNWDYGIVGKKSFSRSNSPVFVFHFKVLQAGGAVSEPRIMIGVTDDIAADSYTDNVHSIYFASNSIVAYEGGSNRGTISSSTVATGDTFKVIMEPQTSGFDYTIYKNEDYTTPLVQGTIGSFTEATLYPSIQIFAQSSTLEFYSIYAYDSSTPGGFDIKQGGSFGFVNNSGSEAIFSQGGFSLRSSNIDVTGNSLRLGDTLKFDGSNLIITGSINATSGNFTGTISAGDGDIGGWTINNGNLSATNITLSSDNQKIDVGSGIDINGTGDSNAGSITIGSNVTLNGSSDSSISGWTIGTGTISTTNLSLDATNERINLGSNITLDSTGDTNNGSITIGSNITLNGSSTSTISGFNVGENLSNSGGSTLVLKGVTGEITASAALIGGSSTIAGFDITDTQISDSGTNLILKDNGEITGSQVLFTGGDIGGWSISSTDLRSTDGSVRLESDTNSIVLFDSSGNDYITFGGNGLISQDDSLPSSTQRNVIDVSRDKIYVGEYTPNDFTGASDTFVRIGTGNTGLRVANTNAVITGSLKVTDIPSPGSVTNALFVGADNQIVQETLGSLAFSSATYDNYQYWQITDGTNTTNVGSTNLISFSGGTGISTSLPVLSQTMTISLDLTEITLSSGLDSTATSLTLDLTEVGFTGGADRLITNDNDGTVTAEANLTFDGVNTLTIGEGTSDSTFSEIIFKVYDGDIGTNGNNVILKAPAITGAGTRTFELPDIGASATKKLPFWNSGGTTNNAILTNSVTNYGIDVQSNLTYNGTDLTIINGNVNVSSGYGIDFAATGQAGGMTSELLDDYEEGTWTPAYKGRSGSTIYSPTAGSTSNTSATYTKIGNKVFFSCYMRSSGITFASSTYILVVDNLPFVCGEYTSVGISYADQFAGDYPAGGYVESGQDYIVLTYRNASDGDIFGMNTGDLSNGDNVNDIMLAGFYTI